MGISEFAPDTYGNYLGRYNWFFLSFLRSKIVVLSNYSKNTVGIQVPSYESYRKKWRHYKEHRNSRYTLVFIPDAQLFFLDDFSVIFKT
jgi:hypothetical protein